MAIFGCFVGSKNFNIELQEVTFGTHLHKHLHLLVGYCKTSVTGSHARLDHNMNSESIHLKIFGNRDFTKRKIYN